MSRVHPLRIRPGLRYTCHGDGLCCTDVHAWGPLDEAEAATLRMIDDRVVIKHGPDLVILGKDDGTCMFSMDDGCVLHASLGADAKPASCRQFPFMLVATPTGGRIATEHRCPCRTMGERAEVTVEDAMQSCDVDALDRTITTTLPLTTEEEIDLPTWEAIEAPFLTGEERVDAEPFSGGDWEAIGRSMRATDGDSRYAAALRVFGGAILGEDPLPRLRWTDVFDRAEARSPEAGDPEAMVQDWIRDVIWSLDWAFHGSWEQAQIDLATRAEIARRITRTLGRRPDRAMAEAIAVVELAGLEEEYTDFVGELD